MTYERYINSEEFRHPDALDILYYDEDVAKLFDVLDAGRWIKAFRTPARGQVDIAATAEAVGIPVSYEMPEEAKFFHGLTTGVGKGYKALRPEIFINPRFPGHTVTFGHELGHVFAETATPIVHPKSEEDRMIEAFCNYFGRQFALPLNELGDVTACDATTVAGLVEEYNVEPFDVFHQLALKGLMPRLFAVDIRQALDASKKYAGKIARCTVCLDCATNAPHDKVGEMSESIPIVDCTEYEWSKDMPFMGCSVWKWGSAANHRDLNIAYDNWTDEDEAAIQEDLEEERENAAGLARAQAREKTNPWDDDWWSVD